MKPPSPETLRILELEARVAALEEALKVRSQRLRRLQRRLCPRDLRLLHAVFSGDKGATAGLDLSTWNETVNLTPAEVEESLERLWASLERETSDQPEGRRP